MIVFYNAVPLDCLSAFIKLQNMKTIIGNNVVGLFFHCSAYSKNSEINL